MAPSPPRSEIGIGADGGSKTTRTLLANAAPAAKQHKMAAIRAGRSIFIAIIRVFPHGFIAAHSLYDFRRLSIKNRGTTSYILRVMVLTLGCPKMARNHR